MPYLSEPEPPRGEALRVLPGIRRVVAPNPGPMTYHGTNTYLVDTDEGVMVIDPGPPMAGHVAAVLSACRGRVAAILLTHRHLDHAGAADALRSETGAPVVAWPCARAASPAFEPDVALTAGARIGPFAAVHTPGHAGDHVSYARPDGILFCGDLVLPWVSTAVFLPDGNMGDYIDSLRLLRMREDRLLLPGHGPAMLSPRPFIDQLIAERLARGARILEHLGRGAATLPTVVDALYGRVSQQTFSTAERTILPYLQHLEFQGKLAREGDSWVLASTNC